MIKFNELMSMNEITECYKNGKFPNAYCLLWNHSNSVNLLTTQNDNVVNTEQKENIEINAPPRF